MPTLHERFEAATDQSYYPRVRTALAITASMVANEDPNATNHENRIRYAREVYRNPDAHIAYWMFGITGSPNFALGGDDDPATNSAGGDNALLWTMASLWDGYSGTGEATPPSPESGGNVANIF